MYKYFSQNNWFQQLNNDFWSTPNRMMALKVVIPIFIQSIPFIVFSNITAGITMSLGTVAAALSETDDHPKGKLKSVSLTIISFAITTISVSLLKPYPIVFGIGFILSTILFVLIGGVSERYRGISYGAILIGIYAMLVYDNNSYWYIQPVLLLSGALIYGIISLFLLYRKPWRLLEEQLSYGFKTLSEYLDEKAKLFPVSQNNTLSNNKLSILNIKVVASLERCKEVINIYNEQVDNQKLLPFMQRFMLLQSLHERAASSHAQYENLKEKNEYAELLDGFSELLHQLSHATWLLADSMLTNTPYIHPVSIGWIISSLEFEIEKIPEHDRQLLELLLHNLTRSHQSLKTLNNLNENSLIPRLSKDSRSFWQGIKDQLNFSHPRLKYAIRLSACFLIAYIIVNTYNIEFGEWIMLTSLFVSQPTYSETRRRLFQRILGTTTGVITGITLMYLTSFHGQLVLILLSVYFFFYFLRSNYSYSVVFITIYVLAGNNFNNTTGFQILTPRLIDTFLGALLSFLSVRFLWPNWQHKKLPNLLINSLTHNAKYLNEIGKYLIRSNNNVDDYDYRLARRQAHKSDNALTLAWQSMQVEPHNKQHLLQQAFTLTYLNHALISHLSTLGSEREYIKINSEDYIKNLLNIESALYEAAQLLKGHKTNTNSTLLKTLLLELKDKINSINKRNDRHQLRLLYNIAAVTNKLLKESQNIQK